MSIMNRPFKRTVVAAALSVLSMSVLPACEKGLMLKDPKITAPDFELKTQDPAARPGERASFTIDLRTVNVSNTTASEAEANDPQYTAYIEFKLTNKGKPEQGRLIQVTADVKASKLMNTSGRIAHQDGEPEMTWQARCTDDCAKFYISVAFDFKDNAGLSSDIKYMVVGMDSDQSIVKRHLFDFDVDLQTLTKQIAALEAMDPQTAMMKTAETAQAEERPAEDVEEKAAEEATVEEAAPAEPAS